MSNDVLTLKAQKGDATDLSTRRRKIDHTDWPDILARRDAGASQTEIAHAYGVSQGTISQAIKRARAEGTTTPTIVSGEVDRTNDQDRPAASSKAAQAPDDAHPLAERLRAASARCAELVEARGASEEALDQAVHEVRRSLAAIEIDVAKQAAAPRAEIPPSEPDQRFGRIKFFKPDKGFGFIVPDDGNGDVFLGKYTAAEAGLLDLDEGDLVTFTTEPGRKREEVRTVTRLG